MKLLLTTCFSKLKRNSLPLTFLLFTILLICFSSSNMLAAKEGLALWANHIFPSLFPFFIAVELLNHTYFPVFLGNLFHKLMKPLFNVPGIGTYALFMGIVSGYPVGAKIVTDLRKQGLCTKEEGERLLTFTNNSSPLFIIASVGISMFHDTSIGILLLATHLLACLTVAFVFRFWKQNKRNTSESTISYNDVSFESLGLVLSQSIANAIRSVIMIGGFIVFFSVVLSMLHKLKLFQLIILLMQPSGINTSFVTPVVSGMLELTSGINLVSLVPSTKLGINVIISAFLLGFGGISILLQVWSITSKSDLSIKPYLYGKLLQGIFASFYTFLIVSNVSYFKYLLF